MFNHAGDKQLSILDNSMVTTHYTKGIIFQNVFISCSMSKYIERIWV
jgi:hypothetical protein